MVTHSVINNEYFLNVLNIYEYYIFSLKTNAKPCSYFHSMSGHEICLWTTNSSFHFPHLGGPHHSRHSDWLMQPAYIRATHLCFFHDLEHSYCTVLYCTCYQDNLTCRLKCKVFPASLTVTQLVKKLTAFTKQRFIILLHKTHTNGHIMTRLHPQHHAKIFFQV